MQKTKNRLSIIFLFIIIVICIITGLIFYHNHLRDNLARATCETLDEITQQQKFHFASTIRAEKDAIKAFAQLFAQAEPDKKSRVKALNAIAQTTPFEYMMFATLDGQSINNRGTTINIADQDYFSLARLGQTVISEPIPSKINNSKVIVMATPVEKNGQIIGVLIGSYASKKLDQLLLSSFNNEGYAYIITNKGDIIAKTVNAYPLNLTHNLFDTLRKETFYHQDHYKHMRYDLYQNKPGHTQYNYKGEKRTIHYDAIGINDWNILVIVPEATAAQVANSVLQNAIWLTLSVLALFFLLILYIYKTQKSHLRKLTTLAYVDELTGARNYNKFKIDVTKMLRENPDQQYNLIKLDIDRFKLLNELYGFDIGDKVLTIIAQTIEDILGPDNHIYARINADEFIVFSQFPLQEEFEQLVNERTKALIDFKMVIPMGHYLTEAGDLALSEMLEKVNFAHHLAKKTGLLICDYNDKIKILAIQEKEIENKMEDALSNEKFVVYLQPKYQLSNERITGAEALVRWQKDGSDILYPDSFIPIFERNGFIKKLDLYMFEKVCQIIRTWMDTGISPIPISVNFSRLHLNTVNFVALLAEIADRYQVAHHLLEIELTETTIFDNLDILEDILGTIHQAGFTLSMDDFGTGYSSLGLLKNIPVDVLKMDRNFFTQSRDDVRAKIVIGSVIDMSKKLMIHTVAEGVETKEHIDFLRELGCDIVQGYYYAKPMPLHEFNQMLAENLCDVQPHSISCRI